MKRFSILFIIVLIASGCATEEEKTSTTTIGLYTPYAMFPETLQGKVKSVIETSYFVKEVDGEFVKADRISIASRDTFSWTNDFKVMYDEMGVVVKSEYLDENDKVISADENMIEDGKVVQSDFLKDDTLRMQSQIKYDENGFMKKIKRMRMPEDTLINVVEIKTDSTGKMIAFRFVRKDGEPGYSYKFKFDENGVNTGYIVKNPEGEKTLDYDMVKNEKGFMTEQKFVNKNGESITEITYKEYDKMGNWISSTGMSDDGTRAISERVITYYEE